MSPGEVARQVTEAFNRHDAKALAENYSRDVLVHDPQYPEPLKGRDAARKDFEAWFKSFPDVRAEVSSVMEDGNNYAIELKMTGTHRGPIATPDGGTIPPTNKRVESKYGSFGKVDGNEIVEERRYYDLGSILSQIGVKG
jgi:steroid delta-isomerase-like uncharacterized protein